MNDQYNYSLGAWFRYQAHVAALAGCTNEGPEVGWIFGTRQHAQIRGVGDHKFVVPMMVAIGCPNELYNRTGGGLNFCNACEMNFPKPTDVQRGAFDGSQPFYTDSQHDAAYDAENDKHINNEVRHHPY